MKPQDEKRTVSLPADLYRRIGERMSHADFLSVDEYVVFVLEEVLKEDETEVSFSEEEEEMVKKRLKALGYLK
ncbi:MAG: CopG family transcriptional regulator [Chloroflexi bacterium]|nr:CopG family transcriptional regulator [Chloroflexota bacterium]